jgi:hypothetical protein
MGIRLEAESDTEALVFRTGAQEPIGYVEAGPYSWDGILFNGGLVCSHTTADLAAWGIVDELRRQEALSCKTSTR